MLDKYKVRIVKRYDFELDGKDEGIVLEQVAYFLSKPNILNKPYIKKNLRINVKKVGDYEKTIKEITNK